MRHRKSRQFTKRFRRRFFQLYNNAIVRIFIGIFGIALIGSSLIIRFESDPTRTDGNIIQNFGTGIWWAFVTLTTTGYGDTYPITTGGRIIGVLVMIGGIAVISVLTATISSAFVESTIRKGQGLEKVKIKNHLVICGWNFNVDDIILTLEKELDFPSIVLINSCDPGPIGEIINRHTESEISFVSGDFSRDAVLDKANVRQAECVIIVADSNEMSSNKADEKTILTTLTIKNMNSKTRVYAHIVNPENEAHLKRAKADDVVVSDKYSGFLLAMHVSNPGVPRAVDEILTFRYGQVILRMNLPDSLIGKTFWEASDYVKQHFNALLIGIAKETHAMALNDMLSDDNSYIDQFIRQRLMQSEKKFGEEERLKITVNPERSKIIEAEEMGIIITDWY
jgi:voltage-gated potassium channel